MQHRGGMMNDIVLDIIVSTGGICCSILVVLLTICSCAMVIERLKKK